MGEARRKGQWIAKELIIKFGSNPRDVTPEEAEGYLYNLRQSVGRKPLPQGFVSKIWQGLRAVSRVDLLQGVGGGGVESKSEVRQSINSGGFRQSTGSDSVRNEHEANK